MESLKNKIGILVAILCIAVLVAAAWYFLAGSAHPLTPEGTLVRLEAAGQEACL